MTLSEVGPPAVDPRLGHWLRRLRRTTDRAGLGLPPGPRSRGNWLTQVEVARLAGCTPRAYQLVEQGVRVPGPRLAEGIVRALRLDPQQQAYLNSLLNPVTDPPTLLDRAVLQRLVDASAAPAMVFDRYWTVVVVNAAMAPVSPYVVPGANLGAWLFSRVGRSIVGWERETEEFVARYRLAQAAYPAAGLTDPVMERLCRVSERARLLWAGAGVAADPVGKRWQVRMPSGQLRTYEVTVAQLASYAPGLRLAFCLPVSDPA
ncbi:helix-turn-helix domain-containing protein [Polymorphospora sp. NPDC051019]|uniref:helix-turn-helix domain-containing protein n=1 Tax=Polymorphospora sp. NPDC051019 TaxID=3155725 RepID=UPI0034239AC2